MEAEPRRTVEIEGPLGIEILAFDLQHKLTLPRQNVYTASTLYEHRPQPRDEKGYIEHPRSEGAQATRDVGYVHPSRFDAVVLMRIGTTRAYISNHILGVSEGHTAILRMVGVGFRATIEPSAVSRQAEYPGQQFVSLKVGYSHPIEMPIPLGMKASVPQPTRILLEGPEKEVVNQFAAEIRQWRVPEPYKGKGIFVNGETIKLKAKKIK